MRASISIRRQVWLSKSASWAIVRNTPALAETTWLFPRRQSRQSTPPWMPPKAIRPVSSIAVPHSAHCSSAGGVAQEAQGPELESRQPPVDGFARRQRGERFIGQIEKFRMRIVVVGQTAQQFRDVVTGIKPRQVPARGPEPPHEPGFGHQVERFGRFVEEDYSTMGEYVKSRLEGVLQPAGTLRQSADLAEFPREKRDHEARFAEIGDAEHQGAGFFG